MDSGLIFPDKRNKAIYEITDSEYDNFDNREIELILKYFCDISSIYAVHKNWVGINIMNKYTIMSTYKSMRKNLFSYNFGYKKIVFHFTKYQDSYIMLDVLLDIPNDPRVISINNNMFLYNGWFMDGYDGLEYMMEMIKEWLLKILKGIGR